MMVKTFCTIVDMLFHIVLFVSMSLVTAFPLKIGWKKMAEGNGAWTTADSDYAPRDILPSPSPVRRIPGLTVAPKGEAEATGSPCSGLEEVSGLLYQTGRHPPPLVVVVINPQLG